MGMSTLHFSLKGVSDIFYYSYVIFLRSVIKWISYAILKLLSVIKWISYAILKLLDRTNKLYISTASGHKEMSSILADQ
jgi:hypothetical protein